MQKLLLIDGSSLLTTSFYGIKNFYGGNKGYDDLMKTSDGRITNGVYGMMKSILKIIQEQKITHLVVAFDVNRETFRREIYPEYKSNRKDTPVELKSQFPLAIETLKAMNITHFSVDRFEADDILGSLAKKFEKDIPTYILTKDRDALQLITEDTKVWLNTSKAKDMVNDFYGELPKESYNVPINHFEFTPDTFEHFYKIKPMQIIDMKAIEGDTSDNIPGVKGVGPKAVIPLIREFGTVEAIYDYIEDHEEGEIKSFFKELGIKASPLNKLNTGKDLAFLSKQLATINVEMDYFNETKLDDLILNINEEGMIEKFKELEFHSLLK